MRNQTPNSKRKDWRNPPQSNYTVTHMARPASRTYEATSRADRPAATVVNYSQRPHQPRKSNKTIFQLAAAGFFLVIIALLFIIKPHFTLWQNGSSTGGDQGNAPLAAQASQPTAPAVAMPAGQTNILLLGSDQRPDDPGYRTDVIILLTIDTDQKTVSAVSFPRDLWVQVPSMYEMKINQVFELGGFDAMAEMFEANFEVKPDYYVLTNFAGFTQVIDSQGGVDVDVAQELTDACDLPQAVNDNCTVKPGVVHMDGPTALWYVRSRYTSSDFDRLRRAQEVVYALFKKMLNVGTIAKLPELKTQFDQNVQTNISVDQAVSFLPLATTILTSPDRIHRFAITEDQAYPTWSWNGMWILMPDPDAIRQLLLDAGIKLQN